MPAVRQTPRRRPRSVRADANCFPGFPLGLLASGIRWIMSPPRMTVQDVQPAAIACTHTGVRLVVGLSGAWRLGATGEVSQGFWRELASDSVRRVSFDASGLESWDSSLLTFLLEIEERCQSAGVDVDRAGLPEGVQRLLELAEAGPDREEEMRIPRFGRLARVGLRARSATRQAKEFLVFLGTVTLAAGRLLRFRARFRRADLLLYLDETGAGALPIITLISLLVGLILAFVGAMQLRQFGADIFIANLVGIAMLREMGAMMAGIIMAGRTGAAFAAQLGTMKVTEEIDALSTFGIPPIEFLVLPRIVALTVMMPLLCVYADILGILGGAIVGTAVMGISTELYWHQTLSALQLSDLVIGMFKAGAYGALIAISGCLRGMQVRGSASAVGAAATSAVVTAIVAIIVADGIFAVLCNLLGI